LAVPDVSELRPYFHTVQQLMKNLVLERIGQYRWQVQTLQRSLNHLSPRVSIAGNRQRLDGWHSRLERAVQRRLDQSGHRLNLLQTQLTAVSPKATLERGYAIVRDGDGRIIRTPAAVKTGDPLTVQVRDGQFGAVVTEAEEGE
jgi:exodeoxyribonuclease VII large subunit